MLAHAGFKPLWPVVLFTPWLVLGLGYLLRSVRKPPGGASRTIH
jgi:hypothetical protein